MDPGQANNTPATDPRIPDRLVEELRGAYRPVRPIGGGIDAAVVAMARAHLAARRRRRMVLIAGTLAAAAGLAIAAVVAWPGSRGTRGGPITGAPGRVTVGDINGDGVVDMLDALVLAKDVERRLGRDINGDGVVDSRDVDAVAQLAVRLDGGTL